MKFASDIEALNTLGSRLSSDFGRHEIAQLTKGAKALAELADSGRSEQHVQRVSLAAKGFQDSLKRTRAELAEREQGGLRALSEARKERLKLATDKAYLPVVTAFQNADSKARLQWFNEAVEAGDGNVLAALIETPHYVHGITPEMLSKHLDLAEERHAPDLAQRRAKFDADRETIHAALRQGEALARKAVDLESIQAAERADKAEEQLNQATS